MAEALAPAPAAISPLSPRVTFIGDSWTCATRLGSYRVTYQGDRIYVSLGEHSYYIGNGEKVTSVIAENYSRSSLTMQKCMQPSYRPSRRMWANRLPTVTVLHLGSCDLANTYFAGLQPTNKIKQVYPNAIETFIEEWAVTCRKHANNKASFDEAIRQHKWLVVAPADWGPDFIPKNEVTPELHKELRRKATQGLYKKQAMLWLGSRAALVSPGLSQPERQGNHLAGASRWEYADKIINAASSLICSSCSPTIGSFNIQEHKRLPEKTCVHQHRAAPHAQN